MDLALNTAGGDTVGRLGMTLSAIACLTDANAISQALATNPLTKGRWTLVWYGVDDSKEWDANQAYVAKDGLTGQLAIVIRADWPPSRGARRRRFNFQQLSGHPPVLGR